MLPDMMTLKKPPTKKGATTQINMGDSKAITIRTDMTSLTIFLNHSHLYLIVYKKEGNRGI